MSLPATTKDISSHPAKNSVTDPVNKEAKERDVNRKLKFYTIIRALRESNLPSNHQVDGWLSYLYDHITVNKANNVIKSSDPNRSISRDGQRLINDSRDIIADLRLLLSNKNSDELIQEFIWSTRDVQVAAPDSPDPNTTVSKDKAQEDANTAARHVRTLMNLLATNSEARKLLSDFGIIGRDLLSKGLVKASERVRPDEAKLRGVDAPTSGDEFVTSPKESDVVSPDLKARLPGESSQVPPSVPPTEEVKTDVHGTAQTAKDTAKEKLDTRQHETKGVKETAKETARETADKETSGDSEEAKKKRNFMNRMVDGVRDLASDNQDRARAHQQRAQKFLTEEYFPPDRRDQFIFRLKKVIVECQKHQDYQESLEWLISFIKEYATHGRTLAQQHTDKISQSDVAKSEGNKKVLIQLQTMLERFAGGKQIQGTIVDPVNAVIDDASRDPELRAWWTEVGDFAERSVREPGYVLEPRCNSTARRLMDSGKVFYGSGSGEKEGVVVEEPKGKYREHLERVVDGFAAFMKGFAEDKDNARLGKDIQRLTKDLLFADDGEGGLRFKPELWNDVRCLFGGENGLVQKIGYVPIPRIEYTDDTFDLVVENLTLSGRNLFPNVVEVDTQNYFKFSPYDNIKGDSHHSFTITMHQIQADLRDVAFWFRKKGGAIKVKDSGLADVVISGEGMSITIHLTSTTDPTTLYAVKDVNVKLPSNAVKFSIRDSKHDVLYKTLKPMMMGLVRKQIQKAVADGIRGGLDWVGEELVAVKERMDEIRKEVVQKAVDGEEGEVEEVTIGRLKAVQEAFKRRTDSSVNSMSVKSGSSQFKVVSNKRNSLLVKEGVGHPAGWVNRVDEREKEKKDLGGWKSEVFDLH